MTSSAALVFDTSVFGATSPVQGQRYRLEATPTFGEITLHGVLADYRRYFMPVPFYTIAARVMHYGRYGTGGEDVRLFPLYIGYPKLVRGYDVEHVRPGGAACPEPCGCPAFDRLLGSRMLVGNLEFRFPLLRPFGVVASMYGPLPVEVALFADAGVAWIQGEKPSLLARRARRRLERGRGVPRQFLRIRRGRVRRGPAAATRQQWVGLPVQLPAGILSADLPDRGYRGDPRRRQQRA